MVEVVAVAGEEYAWHLKKSGAPLLLHRSNRQARMKNLGKRYGYAVVQG